MTVPISTASGKTLGMEMDDPAMLAARNAFLVLLVVLFAFSVYQFAFVEDATPTGAVFWALGAGVFYFSRYYYRKQAE